MESHPEEDSKNHQLLDLTCSKKNGIPDSSELLILDLSRKSTEVSTRAINTFCTTFPLIKTTDVLTYTFSTLPADANKRKQKQPDDFTNTWKSDQFQNSIMIQEESSKNIKNEQIYNDRLSEINRINNSIKSSMITNYQNDHMNSSLLLTRLALPPNSCPASMEPILSNFLTNNKTIPKTPVIQSPTTASLAVESVTSVLPLEPRLSISSDTTKKMTRPFKAYPRDPITLSINSEQYYDQNLNLSYEEFRKMMMEHVNKVNGGTNSKMRRVTNNSGSPTSTVEEKDAAYWERRKKNNEAAKRSRDARRAKEDEIAIRVAFLEQENMRLKCLMRKIFKETEDRNIHLNTLTVHEIKDYLPFEL